MSELPPEPDVPVLASLGARVVARVVDGILLVLVSLAISMAFGDVRWGEAFDVPGWVRAANLLLSLAYEVLLIALTGQTIGKRLLGVRVVDATTGELPGLGQAGRRAIPNLLGLVPIIGSLAPLLYLRALWHPRRQGYHDAFAATVVVAA